MNQDGERNLKKENADYQNNIYEFHYKVNLLAERLKFASGTPKSDEA